MIGPDTFAASSMRWWRCIPCGTTNVENEPFCCICGRARDDATDAMRWKKFFTLDAVIFPDADTERAVRLGASWPGSIETDMAALPADKAFDPDYCDDCGRTDGSHDPDVEH